MGPILENLTIAENGHIVGQVKNQAALRTASTFPLADGRSLTVQLRRVLMSEDLEVLIDGEPVAGSSSHPAERFKQALYTLLLLAAFNGILGIVAEIVDVELFKALGLGYGTVVVGMVYLGLYWWAKNQFSSVALYIAIGILILDFILAVVYATDSQAPNTPGAGVLMRVIFCTLLYKGAQGAKQLKASQTEVDLA
ncbi:hypothetical protein MUN82_04735 [Hymenobacter aerilatus]|uniref:Uncharacterized protein n=1 Tax=Hymenobacter aerilatus TaxID=2932251 RepID=A0A8T9T095_9BACT|nr:hypothetical protein [Hymenobacter aerilatus]UOR06403.1 hypothetical protein MUN82_04735 [Hymenobacter aerilatus]